MIKLFPDHVDFAIIEGISKGTLHVAYQGIPLLIEVNDQTMETLMERMNHDNRMVLIDLKTKQLVSIELEAIE
ncbi:riboflavin synthase subunit alpha [Listeria monocytogenes]|nr:riboflavin synthase subunit alpha [Listeria monocytogenes]